MGKSNLAIWGFWWLESLCKMAAMCIHPGVWCAWDTFRLTGPAILGWPGSAWWPRCMLDALELLFSVEISLSHASFFSLLSLGAAMFKKRFTAVRTVCPIAVCEAGQSPPLLTYLLYKLYGGYLSFLFRSAQAWPDDEFWLLVQDHFPQPGQRAARNNLRSQVALI